MRRHALPVLIALVALLALALLALWVSPSGELHHVRWRAPAPQTADYAAMVPALPEPAAADTRRFVALLERPLFSPTRRPPPPKAAEEGTPSDAMGAARLLGLFEGKDDGGAIIQIDGKPRRVRLHEAVEGWQLSAVQQRSATFTRAGQTRVLQLTRAVLTGDPAQAAGAAPQPPAPAPVRPVAVVPAPAPVPPPALAAASPATAPPAAKPPQANPARPGPPPGAQPVFGGSAPQKASAKP